MSGEDHNQNGPAEEPTFEDSYRQHEFSELVSITLSLADWIFRPCEWLGPSPERAAPREKYRTRVRRDARSGSSSAGLLAAALICSTPGDAEEQHPTAEAIPVHLHVVACAPNLLHCRDVDARRGVFGSMAACEAEMESATTGAARLVRPLGEVVFARCRYSPAAARLVKRKPLKLDVPFGSRLTFTKFVAWISQAK